MKVRECFVSNSSSSSFLIIGREIDISKVTNNMIKKRQIIAMGDDLDEGQDVFQIRSAEELAFLKALKDVEGSFSIIDACVYGSDDGDGEIDVKNLPKDGKLKYHMGMRDDHSSGNINTLKERYDEYGEVSKAMQKYLRGKKIDKIEKENMINKK